MRTLPPRSISLSVAAVLATLCGRSSALLLLGLAALPWTLAAGNVSLTDNGTTVTLANGQVSATFTKADGTVISVTSTALPGTNLVDSSGIGLQLTHIGAGSELAPTDDYWMNISGGAGATYSVGTNTPQMVDIQIRNAKAAGDMTKYPNGLWDWSIHHVMRAGDPGFYTYHVWRHNATHPQSYWQADSWQGHTSGIFSASPNNLAWQFTEGKTGLSFGASPAGSNSNGVPGEVVILPQSSYFTHPTGQYYESGWPIYDQPTGPTHDLLPTWTKYDWPGYLGASTSYRNTWGVANDQVGLWRCNPSYEWRNGGPTKLTGTTSGNYMYTDDIEGHGLGPTNTTVAAGQVFTKFVGPFFTYVNTGTDHNALWADAQARGAQEVANWPYSWVNEPEADYPRNRGTVSGTIAATTGQSTANAVIILGDPVSSLYPDWFWQGCINYLFWTTADANGNFTIPKVRPGTYTLYSYVPGIFGELTKDNVLVTANGTTNLGTVSWNPPRAQNLLFQVGTPDHSTQEFRFGNLTKQFGLWWRYANEMGTNDLNYTVGQSDPALNWYYAQTIFGLANGTYFAPKWNINFNLPAVPADPVTLTVDLAGGRGTAFYTYVNGVNQTPSAQRSTGIYTSSGADIYRDVVQVGQWQHYTVTLPASAFKVGANTLQLQVRQGGAATTWDTTGYWPELLSGGLMYDAIKLESGAQATQMIQNGVYSILSKQNNLSLLVNGNSTAAGAAVVEWPYQLAGNDQWRFTNLGGDVYSIIGVNSGLALEVQGASTAASGVLDQGTYTGAANQKWQATLNGAGCLAFINQNSGLALDIPGGRTDYQNTVQLIQNTPNNGASQSWFVTPPVLSAVPATAALTAAPPATAGLTASGSIETTTLSWTAAPTAASYTLLRGTTSGGPYSVLASGLTSTTFTDIWLSDGTPYYYVVTATNAVGTSPNSNQASATTDAGAPTGVTASAGNTQIALAWNSTASATSYVVRRGTVSGGPYTTVASTVTANTLNDNGLTNGTPYFYVLAAINGTGTGANSVEVTATPVSTVPLAPTGLTASTGNAQVVLSWNAVAGSTYNVLRSTASGSGYATAASGLSTTAYTDTGVTNGTTYYYVVTAVNAGGSSIHSNQVAATPVPPPIVPANFTALPGNATAALSWTVVPYAASYTLLRGTTSGGYPTTVATGLTGTSYGDTGLANGTTYYYVVKAVNVSGTSANSTQASVTPTANVPSTPASLTARANGNAQISLSWNAAPGAASYLIRRGTASGNYTTTVSISAASTAYNDTGLANGTTYYYALAASNVNGTSGNSNEASATSQAVLPTAPTGLAAVGGNRQAALTWSAGNYVSGYTVKRGTASGSETTVASNVTGTSYTDTGLTNGSAYYYVVAASNSTGASPNSNEATATPSRTSGNVVWQGTGGLFWDTSTVDWLYGSVPVNYQGGDSPVFDDNASSNATSVTLNNNVSPTSVTVSGNNLSYTFLGPGGITGNGSLSFLGNQNTLTLAMPNSYTGQTLIQNGTLVLQSPGSLGATKIVFNNGTLASTYSATSAINLGTTTLNVPTGNTGTVNFSARMSIGPVTGGGTLNVTVPGGSTKYENLYGAWGGSFTGTLNFTGTTATSLLTAYYNGGSPNFDGNLANATVNLDSVALASWDSSAGNTITVGALNGTSSASIVGSAYAGGLALTVGALNTNSSFAGAIANSAGGGATSLTKTGTGTLILSGADTFTGATKVTGGTLLVNGSLSASAVTVSSGVALGGTGTVGGAVTLSSGAKLIVTPGGSLSLTGGLGFGGSVTVIPATLNLVPGTYRLLNYTGTYSGTPVFTYVPPAGVSQVATFDVSTTGQINVTISFPTFSQWAAAAFPGQTNPTVIGAAADPDHDGYSNLLEYFFGTSPSAVNSVNLVTTQLDGSGNLLFDFPMSKSLNGASYTIQQTSDLTQSSGWADTNVQATTLSDYGTFWLMQATIPLGGKTNGFFRLRVTIP